MQNFACTQKDLMSSLVWRESVGPVIGMGLASYVWNSEPDCLRPGRDVCTDTTYQTELDNNQTKACQVPIGTEVGWTRQQGIPVWVVAP